MATGGTNTTTSASTSSDSSARPTAAANASGGAWDPMSTGSIPSRSPCARAVSAASIPIALEFPTIAIRAPRGNGWWANTSAVSNSCASVSTRTTPAWSNSACTLDSSISVDVAASWGRTACLPDFTATTGLLRAIRRASRANLRGLPNDSRYSSTTSVCGSVSQYWSRSLPETSARLPAETNVDRPNPRASASARIAMPNAPDWQKNPVRPRRGSEGASVALSRTPGSALSTPSAFGPTTRIPCARASRTSRSSASAPCGPVSANPADTITSAFTPLASAASRTSSTCPAGTATTARSTGSGISVTEA